MKQSTNCLSFEFFLNDFPWIHWIQWIVTKYKIWMAMRNTLYLVIVIFSDKVTKMKFLLLCLDRYLFNVVSGNIYLPRCSKENVLSITITGNVTTCMSRKVVLVVTILFLDFVIIHWIRWIQWHSFRSTVMTSGARLF